MVCHGGGCQVSFSNTSFINCTLVALEGAQVTLHQCESSHAAASFEGTAVYCHGTGTRVLVQGGSITGSAQGIAVHGGASLEASSMDVTAVAITGVEVKNSTVSLKNCSFKGFSLRCSKVTEVRAVHVHSRSHAELTGVVINGMDFGIVAQGSATLCLLDCKVSGTARSCVVVKSRSNAVLRGCQLIKSGMHGLCVHGKDSTCEAKNCGLFQNLGCGVSVYDSGTLALEGCEANANGGVGGFVATSDAEIDLMQCLTRVNKGEGGYVVRSGAAMKMSECKSDADDWGFSVVGGSLVADSCTVTNNSRAMVFVSQAGGKAVLFYCRLEKSGEFGVCVEANARLTMDGSTVSRTHLKGVTVSSGAKVKVMRCTLSGGGEHGAYAAGAGTELDMYKCVLKHNKYSGVYANLEAVVGVTDCRSEQNDHFGYRACKKGRMRLFKGSSDGKKKGDCSQAEEGVLQKMGSSWQATATQTSDE